MAEDVKKSIKPLVISLRKKGLSYSDIQKEIYVPKSTLSSWLERLKLTEAQLKNLHERKIKAGKIGSQKKITNTRKAIEEIQRSSAADIKSISTRELWLMGIMLYWRERFLRKNDIDMRQGVHFTSSDPHLIKLFLKWLREVGKLKKEEIFFHIFIDKNQRENIKIVTTYWSKITGFPKDYFTHIYFYKNKTQRKKPGIRKRVVKKKMQLGVLRIKVRASSMLARQISGWIQGLQNALFI